MSDKIDIILLNHLNVPIEEISLKRPETYQQLLLSLKTNLKNLPENFIIFYQTENNKEIIINNNQTYQQSKDILFIRKCLEQSIFSLNYNKLPEPIKDIFDEKYNCEICAENIKNEKPLFCYSCQKLFHHRCLEDWDKKKKLQNEILSCPYCKKELPLKEWKQKLDFQDSRKNDADFMDKLNKYESEIN